MDALFQPAVAAIERNDADSLRELLRKNPSLATTRSSIGHPVLLQCLVLSGKNLSHQLEMARVLIDAGAGLDEPLVACASCDNAAAAALLLDEGASVDGLGGWCPLEEALYWNSGAVIALLLQRGARIPNLRVAAG